MLYSLPKLRGLPLRALFSAVLLAGSQAGAAGLLVIKGDNASPEFARVVVVSRAEKFAVSYKAQVAGGGELVVPFDQFFDLVEYHPSILAGQLIHSEDFAPISEVIVKTEEMAGRFPAVRKAAPQFLKPLKDVLAQRDQGLVYFQDRWMQRAEYGRYMEKVRQDREKELQLGILAEQARLAQIRGKETEARAMVAAAEARLKEEARQREEAQKARIAASRQAEEEQARQAAEITRKRIEADERRERQAQNFAGLDKHPLGPAVKSEWTTLAAEFRRAAEPFQGARIEQAALGALHTRHFPAAGDELPEEFGPAVNAEVRYSRDKGTLLVLLTSESGSGLILGCDVKVDARNAIEAGPGTIQLMDVARDISGTLAAELPRAVTACLTSLPRAGAISIRAPLGAAEEDGGYVALTRPQLGSDGSYHTTVLVVIGFPVEQTSLP